MMPSLGDHLDVKQAETAIANDSLVAQLCSAALLSKACDELEHALLSVLGTVAVQQYVNAHMKGKLEQLWVKHGLHKVSQLSTQSKVVRKGAM